MGEVAYQDEVVQTLEKAMQSANVRLGKRCFCGCNLSCETEVELQCLMSAAASLAFLWTAWHWKDLYSFGNCTAIVWVRV